MRRLRDVSVALVLVGPACHASSSDAPPDAAATKPKAQGDPSPAAKDDAATTRAPEPSAPAPRPPGPPSGNTDDLREFEGKSEAELLARFGEPNERRSFVMADCCHEFEFELYNTYPPKAGHDDVEIREWTWDYEGYNLTVWLHAPEGAWVSLDTCLYGDDVEF